MKYLDIQKTHKFEMSPALLSMIIKQINHIESAESCHFAEKDNIMIFNVGHVDYGVV